MNKITLFSAASVICIACTTCNAPSESLLQEAQAFADMKASNSSGIKCSYNGENLVEEAVIDSAIFNSYSGIICVED
jgi:hypothetical protein